MTDYRPLLSRAIANLDPNTGEARRAVYDRARTALVNQLRAVNPPLAEADITRERLSLEEAIRRVEGEAALSPPQPVRSERPSRPQYQARDEQQVSRAAPKPPFRNEEMEDARDAGLGHQDNFEPETPPRREARDPRIPRGDGRFDSRGPAPQSRQEASLRQRGARGRSPADYARDDARRASRTRFVVFGIIFALLLLAGAVGYVHRERILSLASGSLSTKDEEAPSSQTKANDRVPQQAPPPLAPTTQPTGAAIRALLFEENPGSQQFTTINGTATWRTETINPGPGRSPELGIRVDVDIPDRKMQVVVTIRRNQDASLPATHFIEIQFVGNDSFGGVAQVPVVRMKNNEAAQGVPLVGVSVRVMQGFFLIGLSATESDRERNIQFMRSQSWLDIPFIYNNGRRAVIAFEKGAAGEKAMTEAFAAWGG